MHQHRRPNNSSNTTQGEFSWVDQLDMPPQRHLPKPSEPKVRQRSSKACAPCHKRKIKCDSALPCAACTGYGYECKYVEIKSQKNTSTTESSPAQLVSSVASDAISTLPSTAVEEDKVDAQFMASECFVEDLGAHPQLLKSIKTRFTSSHSAVAFPRTLGISLGIRAPPRLQSFGWNPGMRQEPLAPRLASIREIITLDQLKLYSEVFFNEIHPFFGFLDRELYDVRSVAFWNGQDSGTDFEACMCGVVALGSLFAGGSSCPAEAQVVEQGRLLLDLSTAHAPALLSMKHVGAWTLRAIYLRSTTRPHLSWIASCTAMHIAEAIGLHRCLGRDKINSDLPRHISPLEIDLRRRTFWVASTLNQFLSCEYGRTRVTIDSITIDPIAPREGDFTASVVEIMQTVPRRQVMTCAGPEVMEIFKAAMELSVNSPFIGLLKADACFCIFRILRSKNVDFSTIQIESLLGVIRVALDGVKFLATLNHPWWNIVSTPFQSVCVLLSLGTSESLAMAPYALETLKSITKAYDSHLSREALNTAIYLVKGARLKRSQEMASLDEALGIVGEFSTPPVADFNLGDSGIEWLVDDNMEFGDFLDQMPFYTMD